MADQPNPLPQPDDWNDNGEWQELINSVEATDVPIDMLSVLRVHMNDGNRFLFPIKEWLSSGLDINDIEHTVNKWYAQNSDDIAGSDFIVNLDKLRSEVQESTKRTLKGL